MNKPLIAVLRFVFFFLILSNFPAFSQIPTDQSADQSDMNAQGQVPRIEFVSTKYNFGDIYRGSIVSHSFAFENTGNGLLVLNGLHAACGCLNTKIYAKDGKTLQNNFKPNEGGMIRVDFDSSQFSGNVVRSVTAETNIGSSFPTVTLTLMANILQELSSSPALLYIGKIDKNDEKTFLVNINLLQRGKMNLTSDNLDISQSLGTQIEKSAVAKDLKENILNNTQPLKVYAVESSLPAIEVTLNPSSKLNVQQLKLKLNNSLPIGPLNTKVTVWNNSTYYKNYQIPIVGEVVGRVNYSAKYVEFGVVSNLKSAERDIIYGSSLKNFAITSVKINLRRVSELNNIRDADLFEIKKEKVISRKNSDSNSIVSYKLRFKLLYPQKLNSSQSLENSSGVNVSGNFLVKTNDPDYKEIVVPFFGVLRKEP